MKPVLTMSEVASKKRDFWKCFDCQQFFETNTVNNQGINKLKGHYFCDHCFDIKQKDRAKHSAVQNDITQWDI